MSQTTGPNRRCLGCDHDLRGVSTPRCTECGRPFDPLRPETTANEPTAVARRAGRAVRSLEGERLLSAAAAAHDRLPRLPDWVHDLGLVRGILLAALAAWIGAEALATGTTWLPGRHRPLQLTGDSAHLIGTAWIAAAAGLHLRFVWGRLERTWGWAQPLSTLSFIAGTGLWLFTVARLLVVW